MLLTDDVGETLGPVFAGDDLIGHRVFSVKYLIFSCDGWELKTKNSQLKTEKSARVTAADAKQTTVAAFRPWRDL